MIRTEYGRFEVRAWRRVPDGGSIDTDIEGPANGYAIFENGDEGPLRWLCDTNRLEDAQEIADALDHARGDEGDAVPTEPRARPDAVPAEPEGAWCGRQDHDADDCAREGCDL